MNPLRRIRRRKLGGDSSLRQSQSWDSTRFGRTVTTAGGVLKKNLWLWPMIAIVILSVIGFTANHAIESTIKESLRSQLQTLLNAESEMLVKWFEVQAANAETVANDVEVRHLINSMLDASGDLENSTANRSTANRELEAALSPLMSSQGYIGYFVVDIEFEIIASSHVVLIGQKEIPEYEPFLTRVLAGKGQTIVSKPFPSVVMLKDEYDQVRTGEPTMYVCAPVRDDNFQVIGVLALQLRPEAEFTQILQLGRIGESGETYAFDTEGVMVSNSRFDDNLILLGILADQENARSILNVLVRDPGGDMTKGYRPSERRAYMPLTYMAADASSGNSDVDVDGYRDYRGVEVVGAWTWLKDYEIGVATEIAKAEAFRPLTILRRTFWALYALLVASAIAIFGFTVAVARLQGEAQKAAIEAQQLGQYRLEEKLGAGAMGVVYKGHHAMLRRPTAIKLLDVDKVNDVTIKRFEREVQITCKLNHPSTIQIYDYGRTPEGVFYYAMEYLDGIELQELVEQYGPQPGGRVIHILLQACGSLFEAHSQGLVHRDIKPANIMLNVRGGESDVIKVLDFGLVKAIDAQHHAGASEYRGLTGTPLYMSPEAIQSPLTVDARSDLYGLGAVGYFLLTGHTVFEAENIVELCHKHIDETPISPSERLGVSMSQFLENALLSCLEKSRAKRPQTARDLAELLRGCPEASQWSSNDSDAWWRRHERQINAETKKEMPKSEQSQYMQTMAAAVPAGRSQLGS